MLRLLITSEEITLKNKIKDISNRDEQQSTTMILQATKLLLILAAIFFSVDGDFICEDDQLYCRWFQTEKTDWITADKDCIRSGGSLVSGRKDLASVRSLFPALFF